MDIVVFRAHELPVALTVLRAQPLHPSPREELFLQTIARLHGVELDPSALPEMSLAQAAAVLVHPHQRRRLVQLAVIMATVDGRVLSDRASAVAQLARALGVEEPAVHTLRRLAARQILRARFELIRRTLGKMLGLAWREARWAGLCEIACGFLGVGENRATAQRYRQLARLPAGSFGHALWKHCTSRNFALPGERGAIPERALFHDLGHVLSGYDTDPAGEIQQAAFQAGFVRRDGFVFLFFGVVQFHLGIKITPVAAGEVGFFNIEKVLTALARGAACRADLSERWSFWSRAARTLEDVRSELAIPPLA